MKFQGLKPEEKRWRGLSDRLLSGLMARLPGARDRFRKELAAALDRAPTAALSYAIPFPLAERVLGDALLIMANPQDMRHWLVSEAKSEEKLETPRDYFLVDGPLGPLRRRLEDSQLDAEARELIACQGDYRSTGLFETLSRRLGKNGAFHRNGVLFRTPADIDAYCRHHLELIESIKAHGVVRRSELARVGAAASRSTPNAAFLERVEADAGVAVGSNGRLLRYRGGFHRTAAARELGLVRMPVQVKLVHLDWLRRVVEETGLEPFSALVEGLKRLSLSSDGGE
jgi:hypothetical protein